MAKCQLAVAAAAARHSAPRTDERRAPRSGPLSVALDGPLTAFRPRFAGGVTTVCLAAPRSVRGTPMPTTNRQTHPFSVRSLVSRLSQHRGHLPSGRDGQRGQGMVEYGLILVLVALVVIGALLALSGQLQTVFNNISNGLAGGNP